MEKAAHKQDLQDMRSFQQAIIPTATVLAAPAPVQQSANPTPPVPVQQHPESALVPSQAQPPINYRVNMNGGYNSYHTPPVPVINQPVINQQQNDGMTSPLVPMSNLSRLPGGFSAADNQPFAEPTQNEDSVSQAGSSLVKPLSSGVGAGNRGFQLAPSNLNLYAPSYQGSNADPRSPAAASMLPPGGVATNNSNIVPTYNRVAMPPSRTGDLRSLSNTPSAVTVQPGAPNQIGAADAFNPSSRAATLNASLNEDSVRTNFRPVAPSTQVTVRPPGGVGLPGPAGGYQVPGTAPSPQDVDRMYKAIVLTEAGPRTPPQMPGTGESLQQHRTDGQTGGQTGNLTDNDVVINMHAIEGTILNGAGS